MGSPASLQERLALLDAASRKIGTTLDLFETGRELMEVVVPRFADAAGVLVQDRVVTEGEFPPRTNDGSALVRRIAVGVAAPSPGEYGEAFPVDEVVVYESWTPYARSMESGKSILYPGWTPGPPSGSGGSGSATRWPGCWRTARSWWSR
nr:hypothetical protein GCM10020093_047800 [Planobispora longispora]